LEPEWFTVSTPNTTVVKGKSFAIVVSIPHAGDGDAALWLGSTLDGYAGGRAFISTSWNGTDDWRADGNASLSFRTHVSPSGLSGALRRGGTPLKLLIVPGAAFGFMAGAFGPAALASLADVSQQKRRGMTMGLYSFVISAAMTVGPIMSGAIIDRYGGKGVLTFMTACALLMMVFVLIRWYDARLEAKRTPPPVTDAPPPASEERQGPGPSP
jgi:MFS family permease